MVKSLYTLTGDIKLLSDAANQIYVEVQFDVELEVLCLYLVCRKWSDCRWSSFDSYPSRFSIRGQVRPQNPTGARLDPDQDLNPHSVFLFQRGAVIKSWTSTAAALCVCPT